MSNKHKIPKLGRSIAVVLLLAFALIPTQRSHSQTNVGLLVWARSIEDEGSIDGGHYATIAGRVFYRDLILFDIGYLTNLVPSTFQDHLVSASMLLRAIKFDDDLGTFVGVEYLADIESLQSDSFIGIRLHPINSLRAEFDDEPRFMIDLFSVSVLLNPQTHNITMAYSLFDISFFL